MASSFAWLDTSESDRRRALDVIDLFREQDSRDELGLGSIRDAYSDLLVPGISTLMRRAAYYLFIPWICLSLEKKKTPSAQMGKAVRDLEVALIRALLKTEDQDGLLGKEAREHLQRMPSSIYWQGLLTWGIRLYPGSQEAYYRSLDGFHRSSENPLEGFEGEGPEGPARRNWHPGIPARPKDFPWTAQLALRPEDADYLADRIRCHAPGTLLAYLVDESVPGDPTDFPWEHPEVDDMPARLRETLLHARNFAEALHGAALLYNLMLGEASGNAERVDHYRAWLSEWGEEINGREEPLQDWDRERFWELARTGGARIAGSSRAFVDRWLPMALSPGAAQGVPDRQDARELIRRREAALKGTRARLTNPRALELWSGAAGTGRMNYRWPQTQSIVADILRGLGRSPSRA